MFYLIGQILLCVLMAALLGFLVGWFLRGWLCNQKIDELESKIARLESDAATPVVAAVPLMAEVAEDDDLTKIEGIGPKIENLLKAGGITTWALLAASRPDKLQGVLDGGGDRFRLADPASWPDQAKLAADGRWEELYELQDLLIAGRGVAVGSAVSEGDDLKVIEGIGPKIEKHLKSEGVTTWALLAESQTGKLKGILDQGGDRFRIADPSSWSDQAKLASEGRWDELDEFQDILIGGRGAAGAVVLEGDDLKVIEGIGPKIEEFLKSHGVTTWALLAASQTDTLRGILDQGGDRFRIADPQSWPDQAQLAAEGRWKDLDEFQDILLGGREA